jgi:membrane protein involved in colicin uptake
MAKPDNDLDYWKRRDERIEAEARDAQNKAIAAEKAKVDKQALERAAAAGQGNAAKAKENSMSWEKRKAQEAARNKQLENARSEAARKDKNAAKKEALKKMISKFRGGKALGVLGMLSTIDEGGKIMQGKYTNRMQ